MNPAARNLRTGLIAGLVACFMVGMGFAAVPLYRMFCQQTGWGGTARIEVGATAPGSVGRIVTVRFDANTNAKLPWSFEPEQKTQRVAIGARQIAFFDATNLSNKTVTGAAAFNISPRPERALFRQGPVLLLHAADAPARRDAAHARRLLRRPRLPQGSRQ